MTTPETIAPCTLCQFIDVLKPYGHNNALICLPCARLVNDPPEPSEAVSSIAQRAAAQLRKLD